MEYPAGTVAFGRGERSEAAIHCNGRLPVVLCRNTEISYVSTRRDVALLNDKNHKFPGSP